MARHGTGLLITLALLGCSSTESPPPGHSRGDASTPDAATAADGPSNPPEDAPSSGDGPSVSMDGSNAPEAGGSDAPVVSVSEWVVFRLATSGTTFDGQKVSVATPPAMGAS